MNSNLGNQKNLRMFAAAIMGVVFLGLAFFLHHSLNSAQFKSADGFDISGIWEFHNGPLGNPAVFEHKVKVPDPLPDEIRTSLKDEFWYRTEFSLPKGSTDLALYLGSVKGVNEVYWNGKYLGGGGRVSLGLHRIPPQFLEDKNIVLTVRVQKSATLFPGIVHLNRIWLGNASEVEALLNHYYFEIGLKPLLPATFKLVLFFFFLGFFVAVPFKREYFSFSLFALFSALSSAFFSRFLPGYEDIYFRHGFIFLFSVLSLSFVPLMAADFFRLTLQQRSFARIYGGALALIFISAAFWLAEPEKKMGLYRFTNMWLPLLAILPAVVMGVFTARGLSSSLAHRKIQMYIFSGFLLIGMLAWSSYANTFLKFQKFFYPEFLDLFLFTGLAFSMAMDFRFASVRSEKAGKAVPKWFRGFLAGSIDRVTLEIPLLVLAVDTVAYTKKLSQLSEEKKKQFHEDIRSLLAPLTEEFGAQKISERGDGGIFAWDMNNQVEQENLELILAAARHLVESRKDNVVLFRVGMACGLVRAEMRQGDFSFLGEALNSAARLEAMAEPGTALVDKSLYVLVTDQNIDSEKIKAEIKGVTYEARPLKKSA